MVTKHIVSNMSSRSLRLLAKFRQLSSLCEQNGITVSTRHLPSVLNCWADRLSRHRDQYSWALPRDARILLEQRFRTRLTEIDRNALPDPRL